MTADTPGSRKAGPDDIPPFRTVLNRYQDPARQAQIGTVTGGSELEWDRWRATIEYGRFTTFEHLLDFFVNIPSLRDKFPVEAMTNAWYWDKIPAVTLATKFSFRPELVQLLRANAGPAAMITEGWLLKHDTGRVDGETTWADTSYLIATSDYFAYIQLYMETVH